MAHCVHCGEEIDGADVCPNCGTPQARSTQGDEFPRDDRRATAERVQDDRGGEDSPSPPGEGIESQSSEHKYCPNCGSTLDIRAELCPDCGVRQPDATAGDGPSNDQVIAGILAIVLGWVGVHKFYQENVTWGAIYLCFFWTGIPGLLGLIEGILILVADEEEYERKYADGSILGA